MKASLQHAVMILLLTPVILTAAEGESTQKPGIKNLQLVSNVDSIVPGKPVSFGLFIQHLPEYHTYWKAPGIVGVPTSITWDLPKGFTASPIEWPAPQLTKMADYTAYGYERDVCLLSEIVIPGKVEGESVTFKARVAFICCAKTCHPGWHDLELTLPIDRDGTPQVDKKWEKLFAETRKALPVTPAPQGWIIKAESSNDTLQLDLVSPDSSFSGSDSIYCFSENNLVDSDKPQVVKLFPDRNKLTFILTKSKFGPQDQTVFPALLFHPDGWPGTNQKWIRVSVPIQSSP